MKKYKKIYTHPELRVKRFASENIVTLSAFSSGTYDEAVEALTTTGGVTTADNIFAFNVD